MRYRVSVGAAVVAVASGDVRQLHGNHPEAARPDGVFGNPARACRGDHRPPDGGRPLGDGARGIFACIP